VPLAVTNIWKSFAGLPVLRDVSLSFPAGQVTCLIGPNGAGKTTLFNVICGFLKANAGQVHFRGRRVDGLTSSRRARIGLIRTFQDLRLFGAQTVYQNVLVAAEQATPRTFGTGDRVDARERTLRILDDLDMLELRDQTCESLPYAQMKFVSLARCLASRPRVLLLDEPASGLDEKTLAVFIERIVALKDSLDCVIVVEHNLDLVREAADQVAFLHLGQLVAVGSPSEVLGSSAVRTLYLGTG
jgi:ABC-type branched-subunit amino acid transport system ATPase component